MSNLVTVTIRIINGKIATQNRQSGECSGLARTMPEMQASYESLQMTERELDQSRAKWDATVAEHARCEEVLKAQEKVLDTLCRGSVLVAEAHGFTNARDVLTADAGDTASMASRIAEHVRAVEDAGPALAKRLLKLRDELVASEAARDDALKAFNEATNAINDVLLKSSWTVGQTRLKLSKLGVKLKRKNAKRKPKLAVVAEPAAPDAALARAG